MAWFDRRYCVICNGRPTELCHPAIPPAAISRLFEESSESPSFEHQQNAIVIEFNNNPLTLSIPDLPDHPLDLPSNAPISSASPSVLSSTAVTSFSSLPAASPSISPGSGPTFKCKSCFARFHADCLQRHDTISESNGPPQPLSFGSLSPSPFDDESAVVCPVCAGNATRSTMSHYKMLERAIAEERKLLRDLSKDECCACGDVGDLIICDLCCCEPFDFGEISTRTRSQKQRVGEMKRRFRESTAHHFVTHDAKIDAAGQFHWKCVVAPFQAMSEPPNTFLCPLCTTEFGGNRLQSLHFFQRKRMNQREIRMQEKAAAAQRFVQKTGIKVDEVKKCVFCRVSGDDTAEGVFFDKENEFIGPFYDEAKGGPSKRQRAKSKLIKYWAHYQCVMWAPQVFMDDAGRFQMVEAEIKRSKHLSCAVCGKNGAVLGCYEKGCHLTYHWHCAVHRAHCYFDDELFAIYCPQHYFVHFLTAITEGPQSRIAMHRVDGINEALFKKCRFESAAVRNRKVASTKLCKATDFWVRYKSAAEVFDVMGRQQQHGQRPSTTATATASREMSVNLANLPEPRTRHQRRMREQLAIEQKKRQKQRCKRSLMAIGGRKRDRSCLVDGAEENALSPHEKKRRRVFNLQPMTINAETMNIRIEPDQIDIGELVGRSHDMSSMVGGLDEAVNVLKETVLLPLLYPELFTSFSLKPAKGVLLYGPPGTGKTLLVRSLIKYYYAMSKAVYSSSRSPSVSSPLRAASIAVSTPSPLGSKRPELRYDSLADAAWIGQQKEKEAEARRHQSLISFFSRKGPDLLSKFHGETERNLRALFRRAQECSPSIIFFDEIDGMCPTRTMKNDQVHNSVVATLLSLMDGLNADQTERERASRVFVIAATNRIDNIDAALRRPGRFDREIYVGLPDARQRLKILEIHTRDWDTDFARDWDSDFEPTRHFHRFLKELSVRNTEGFSGADLKAFCNETFLNAIHRSCPLLMASEGYSEDIASTLREGVVVKKEDFQKTIDDGFKPSKSRSGDEKIGGFDHRDIERLSGSGKEAVRRLLRQLDIYSKLREPGSVPSRAWDVDSSDDDDEDDDLKAEGGGYVRSMAQAKLIRGRGAKILIHGEDAGAREVALRCCLHHLDIANVQYLSFAAMAATVSAEEAFHSILQKIKLAVSARIGVLVFCDLDVSLTHFPRLIENVLLSNVCDMARDHNILCIATARSWGTADCWDNQWPQAVFRLFDKNTFHIR